MVEVRKTSAVIPRIPPLADPALLPAVEELKAVLLVWFAVLSSIHTHSPVTPKLVLPVISKAAAEVIRAIIIIIR
jgi:hypothetical protein